MESLEIKLPEHSWDPIKILSCDIYERFLDRPLRFIFKK